MDDLLEVMNGRRGKNPASEEDFGNCFRDLTKYSIHEESAHQKRANGFYKTQILPEVFHQMKDNYKHVTIHGASRPDDYFEECPWDDVSPMKKKAERTSDVRFYPKSRHFLSHEYDDAYNDRLAMKKVVRTKPMSFLVFGPSMIGPSPLALKLATKFGAVLIEPRKLVKEYFKRAHKTKNIEYDITYDNEILSSEATCVPAKLLGELILKKLKSYVVYKRGYVLTGIQYCKYSAPENLFSVLNKVFSTRFAPDMIVYVEGGVEDVSDMLEGYSVYPMYSNYAMVENFVLIANEMIEARRSDKSRDIRDDIWYKIGKYLTFEDCVVMEVMQFSDLDVQRKKKDKSYYIPDFPEPVAFNVSQIYNAFEDVKIYYEAALAIHRYVNHMDHHYIMRVKAKTPSMSQFHVVMSRLNCLPVFKIPEVQFGREIAERFVDEEKYRDGKNFVERMDNDNIVGILLSKYTQDMAELDEYDSDQDEQYLEHTTFFDSVKPQKTEDEYFGEATIVDIPMSPPSSEITDYGGEDDPAFDHMTFEERVRIAQEMATLDDKIRYLRTLNLKDAMNSYDFYRQDKEDLSDGELVPYFSSKQVKLRASMSSWGRRCPVAFQHGLLVRGQSKYATRYHDKFYFISSKKALKKFVLDPDRYLFPIFPTTPCNVIVSGHPISGKTVVAEAIASYYNAVVVDFSSLRKEARKAKHKTKLELLENITRAESLRYVNSVGNDIYLNDEFERHEDFLDWFIVVYRLVYFRTKILPPENTMTLPRKHGCVLARKIKRSLSDIEEIEPSNVFKRFLKYVSFHDINEEKQLKDKYVQIVNLIAENVHKFDSKYPIPPGENDKERIRNGRKLFRENKIPYYGSLSILNKYLKDPILLIRYCPKMLRPHKNPFELEPYHPVVSGFALEVWDLVDKTSKDLTIEEEIDLLVQSIYEIECKAKEKNLISYGGWVIDGVFLSPHLWQGLYERGLGNTFVVYLQDPDMDYFWSKLKTKRHVNRVQRYQNILRTLEDLEIKKPPKEYEKEILKRTCRTDTEETGIQLHDYGDFVSSESEEEHSEESEEKSSSPDPDRPRIKSVLTTPRKSMSHRIFRQGGHSESASPIFQGGRRSTTETGGSSLDSNEMNIYTKSSANLGRRYRDSIIPTKMKRFKLKDDDSPVKDIREALQMLAINMNTPESHMFKLHMHKRGNKRIDHSTLTKTVFGEYTYNPSDISYDPTIIENMYNNLVEKWGPEIESRVVQYFKDMRALMDELRNDTIRSGLIKKENYYRRYVGRTDPLKYIHDIYDVIDGHGAVHRIRTPETSTVFAEMEEGEEAMEFGEEEESMIAIAKSVKEKEAFESWANSGKYDEEPVELKSLWRRKYKMRTTPKNKIANVKPILRKSVLWCVVHLREGRTVRAFNTLTYLHQEYPICSKICLKKFRRWPYHYTNIEKPYSSVSHMKISVLGLPGSGSNKVGQILADYLGLKYMNFYDRYNEKLLLPGFFPIGPYFEPALMSKYHTPANVEETPKTRHYDYLMNLYLNHKRRMPIKYWVQFYLTDFKKGGFVYHQMPYSIHDFICMYAMDVMPDVIINIKRKRTFCRKNVENKVLEMWKGRIKEINAIRMMKDKQTRMYWRALYLFNFWKYLRMLVDFFAELKVLTKQSKNEESEEDFESTEPVLMSILGSMKAKKIFYMPHQLRNTRRVKYNIRNVPRPFDMPEKMRILKFDESDGSVGSRSIEGSPIEEWRKSDTISLQVEMKKSENVVIPERKGKETLLEKLRRKVETMPKKSLKEIKSNPKLFDIDVDSLRRRRRMSSARKTIIEEPLKRNLGAITLPSKSRNQSVFAKSDFQGLRKTLAELQFGRSKTKKLYLLEVDAKCIMKKLKALLKKAMHFDPYFNETKMSGAMLFLADDEDPNKVQILDLEGVSDVKDVNNDIERFFIDRTLDRRILESLTLKGIEAQLITKFPIFDETKNPRKFTLSDGEKLLALIDKYREISRFAPYVVKFMEKRYPKPYLLGLYKSDINKDEFKENLAKTLKKESMQIKRMRNYSKVFDTAWLDVKPGRRTMKSIMTAMLNYRMPYGENVYELDFDYVEDYIDNGTYYLSKFGRRCPVECYEKNTLWHSDLLPDRADRIVVAHKRYVYFLSSEDALLKFVENPLKYISHNLYNISLPIRILILGPEISRRMKVAKYFQKKYSFEIVTVDTAMRFLFKNFHTSALSKLIFDFLRRGLGIPIVMVYQALDFYISTCGDAAAYGWVLVGIPAVLESLCVLKELRLLPHLLLVVDLNDKNAYFQSIEKKKEGKNLDGNIDMKIVRYLDRNVAERNFDAWKSEEVVLGTSHFCKQVVNYHISEGNAYPLYNALILDHAMKKLYNVFKASHLFRYTTNNVAAPIGIFNRMDRAKFNLLGSDIRDNCVICWEYEGILTKSPHTVGINDNIYEVNHWCYWICDWHKNQMFVMSPPVSMSECRKPTVLIPTRIHKPVNKDELDFPYCVTCYKNESDILKPMNGERYIPGNKNCLFVCAGRFLTACREECLAKLYKRPHRYITALSNFKEILDRTDLDDDFKPSKEVVVPRKLWPPALKYPKWFVFEEEKSVPKMRKIEDIIEFNLNSQESSLDLDDDIYFQTPTEDSDESIIFKSITPDDSDSFSDIFIATEERKQSVFNEIEISPVDTFKYVDDYREFDSFSLENARDYLTHLYDNIADMDERERDQCWAEVKYEISKMTLTPSQEDLFLQIVSELGHKEEIFVEEEIIEEETILPPLDSKMYEALIGENKIKSVEFSQSEYFYEGLYLGESENFNPYGEEFGEMSQIYPFSEAETEKTEYLSERQSEEEIEYKSAYGEHEETKRSEFFEEYKKYYGFHGEGKRYYGEMLGEAKRKGPTKKEFYIEPEESFEEFIPDVCQYQFTSGFSLESAQPEISEKAPIHKKSLDSSQGRQSFKEDKFIVNSFASDQDFVKFMTQSDFENDPKLCPDFLNTIEQVKEIRNLYNQDASLKTNLPYLSVKLSDTVLPDRTKKKVKDDMFRKLLSLGRFVKVNVNREEFPRSVSYDRNTQTFFGPKGTLAPYFFDTKLSTLCTLCTLCASENKMKYDSAFTITPFCCFMEFEIGNALNETIDHYDHEENEENLLSLYSSKHFLSKSTLNVEEEIDEMIFEEQEFVPIEEVEQEEEDEYITEYEIEEEEGFYESKIEEDSYPNWRKLYESFSMDNNLYNGYPLYETLGEWDPVLYDKQPMLEPSTRMEYAHLLDIRKNLEECASGDFIIEKEELVQISEDAISVMPKTERRVTISDKRHSIRYFEKEFESEEKPLLPPAIEDLIEDDDYDGLGMDGEPGFMNLWGLLQTLGVTRKTYEDDDGRAVALYTLKNILERFIFNRNMLDMIQDPFDSASTESQFFETFDVDIDHWLNVYHEQSHILPDTIELLTAMKDPSSASYILEILKTWLQSFAFGSFHLRLLLDILETMKCKKNEHNMTGYRNPDVNVKNSGIWNVILALERAKTPLDRITTNAASDALHKNRFLRNEAILLKKRQLEKVILEKMKALKEKWTKRVLLHEKALDKRNEFLKIAAEDGNESAYREVYGERKRRRKRRHVERKASQLERGELLRLMKKPKGNENRFERDLRDFLTTLAYDLPQGEPSFEMNVQDRIFDMFLKRLPNFYWLENITPSPGLSQTFFSKYDPDETPELPKPSY